MAKSMRQLRASARNRSRMPAGKKALTTARNRRKALENSKKSLRRQAISTAKRLPKK